MAGPGGRRTKATSLLEDDELSEISGRDESSSGDVCESCQHTRAAHEGGECVRCEQVGAECPEFVD